MKTVVGNRVPHGIEDAAVKPSDLTLIICIDHKHKLEENVESDELSHGSPMDAKSRDSVGTIHVNLVEHSVVSLDGLLTGMNETLKWGIVGGIPENYCPNAICP